MGARADKWLAEEVTTHTLHWEVFDLPHFMAPQYSRRISFLFLWAEFVLLLLEEQQFVGSSWRCRSATLISCEAFYSDRSLPEPPITSHLSHLSKVYSVFLCRRFKIRRSVSFSVEHTLVFGVSIPSSRINSL